MTVPPERGERPMRTIFRLMGGSVSLGVVLASGPAAAGPLDAPGAAKALACSACHGLGGQSPSNTMPVIAGVAPWYFKKAIEDYAAGRRPSPEMEPYAKYVLEAGVDDLASYFASQPRQPTAVRVDAGAVERGRVASQQCVVCTWGPGRANPRRGFPTCAGSPPDISRTRCSCSRRTGGTRVTRRSRPSRN